MPLDAGAAPHSPPHARTDRAPGVLPALRPIRVALAPDGNLGAALRLARQSLGLDASDVAQATRIRMPQLLALEAYDFAALPPRPFVVGFVRAYARAMGVDPEAAVERFRREAPGAPPKLRAPIGLRHEERARPGRWLAFAAAGLVAAVVFWNLMQHASTRPRSLHQLASRPARIQVAQGPSRLGAPLPPPPEAAPPPTYATPGLQPVGSRPANPASSAISTASGDSSVPEMGAPFQPGGIIYGQAGSTSVLLQARKATSLVVRDGAGAITFARQLAAGEAWRAPAGGDLIADVGNPESIRVYVDGRSRGSLTAARTNLADLRS